MEDHQNRSRAPGVTAASPAAREPQRLPVGTPAPRSVRAQVPRSTRAPAPGAPLLTASPPQRAPLVAARPLAVLALAALTVLAAPAAAQRTVEAQRPMELPRVDGAIVVDGRVDEPAWDAVEPLPLTMYTPTFGGDITERTEIRVAYDDEYLYASCRCWDASPDGIRVTSLSRDRLSGDDHFLLLLDTYDDNESGLLFITSPAGVRLDRQVLNDAEGEFLNSSWDTFWDAAAVRNGRGWFAEMRIPLSSLRFQQAGGRVVMGLSAQRVVSRKNERVTFPAIEPDQSTAMLKPSRVRDIVLRGVERRNPVYLTPYVLGGATRTRRTAVPGASDPSGSDPGAVGREWTREIGLDAKYALASNLTLDLTINTDFAQVEADDERVNLTRFGLFFPEKRQFFQERSGIFDIRTGAEGRLFHSRRIGLTGTGEPVRILGGGRLVGRAGGWDVGVLDMQTDEAPGPPGERAVLPSENFGVVRLRRRILNTSSFAGGMLTSRIGTDGDHELAYGLDTSLRLSDEHYLSAVGAQTFENGRGGLRSGSYRLRFADRSQQGLGYRLDASRVGRGYDPGIGFVRRRGVTVLDGVVDYGWFPDAGSPVRRHAPILEGFVYLRNEAGGVESAKIAPNYNIDFKSGASLRFEATLEYEDLIAPFSPGAGATIPAGSHWFPSARVYYATSSERRFGGTVYLRAGDFYDGHRVVAILRPRWWVSPHLELSGRLERTHLWFPGRGETVTADLARLRVHAALDTRLSASAYVQYNGTRDAVIGNLRLRYDFAEGNDLYVVYNEAFDVDAAATGADVLASTRRAVLVKYTYTLAY